MAANTIRPLLVLSDAISGSSGLARIARDISVRVHEKLGDIYRVATYGYGSPGSCKFGFPSYVIEGMDDWVCPTFPQVCNDFFGKERGIVLCIWDLSRLSWLADPKNFPELTEKFPGLNDWLLKANIEKWCYVPLDGSGPNDRLTFPMSLTLLGFDRILAYGPFGESVIRRTIGEEESKKRHLTNLPHGIDADTFFELPREVCRRLFFKNTGAELIPHPGQVPSPIAKDEVLIGIVATNQNRKDWGMAIEAIAIMSHTLAAFGKKIRLWIHTDHLERYWSIPSLCVDYGLLDRTVLSLGFLSDAKMSEAYSACDICFGIGPEGFGLPNAEALACGTPVITGSYAGSADFIHKEMQVDPIAFRFEGVYAVKRPVYAPIDWANKAVQFLGKRTNLDPRYEWNNLWPRWEAYLREAAK